MKKGKKRLIGIFMTVVLLCSVMNLQALATESADEGTNVSTEADATGTEAVTDEADSGAATEDESEAEQKSEAEQESQAEQEPEAEQETGNKGLLASNPSPLMVTASANCKHRTQRWQQDGTSLVYKCKSGCRQNFASITLSDITWKVASSSNVPIEYTTSIVENCPVDVVFPDTVKIMFKSSDASTSEAGTEEVPTTPGTYQMYLEMVEDDGSVVDCDPVVFTLVGHSWSYSASGLTLTAKCTDSGCGATASVIIDTTSVYEASRTYKGGSLNYEVYYETNWSNYTDIAPYTLLYYGEETISRTSTELYGNCFKKPTSTGNYEVCAAVLSDGSDPASAIAKTDRQSYYLADIPVSSCDVVSYGKEQIAQFTEPSIKNETYQVGTKEELLWCLYHGGDCKIMLTDDIVVNPITVDDSGQVRSASYQIYLWNGFGTESDPWEGTISGNGHIIYGLYQNNLNQRYAGLVNHSLNGQVYNITVENSMLYGQDVGAFFGKYEYDKDFLSMFLCNGVNNYIVGKLSAGGSVGSIIATSKDYKMTLTSIGNDSYVKAGGDSCYCGGICGYIDTTAGAVFEKCYNLGDVDGKNVSGGIVGSYKQTDLIAGRFVSCFNTGTVSATTTLGGICGQINATSGKITIEKCTSIGYLRPVTNCGGICGYTTAEVNSSRTTTSNTRKWPFQRNFFADTTSDKMNYFYSAKYAIPSDSAYCSTYATELTSTQANSNFICDKYNHTASTHWTVLKHPTCTGTGELVLKCMVCGTTLKDKTIGVLGHHYDADNSGKCVNCGQTQYEVTGQVGSVFTQKAILGVVIAASAVLICLAVAWVMIRKKKSDGFLGN